MELFRKVSNVFITITTSLLVIGLYSVMIIYIVKFIGNKKDNVFDKKFSISILDTWTSEQQIYYKIFCKVIKKDAPYKKDSEIRFISSMLVTSSKYIPYFAGLVYVESRLPGKWKIRKGKVITIREPRLWHNFSIEDDGGSPSLGYVKIKLPVIQWMSKVYGHKPPRRLKDIDIKDTDWKIRLFKYAGSYFDYSVERMNGKIVDGMAAYRYGINEYRRWKKKHPYTYPWKFIGDSVVKALEYQRLYIQYTLGNKKINGGKN